MIHTSSTFIWEGRIHLGDEPGIYGNAHYAGLCMEFPFTVKNFDPSNPLSDVIKLGLSTENVNIFATYPGHLIVVRLYEPDPQPGKPYKWKETVIKNTDRLLNGATHTVIDIPVNGSATPTYISIAIEVDSSVQPGLYDDFLFTGLHYTTQNQYVYVNFGFKQ